MCVFKKLIFPKTVCSLSVITFSASTTGTSFRLSISFPCLNRVRMSVCINVYMYEHLFDGLSKSAFVCITETCFGNNNKFSNSNNNKIYSNNSNSLNNWRNNNQHSVRGMKSVPHKEQKNTTTKNEPCHVRAIMTVDSYATHATCHQHQ